MAKEKLECNWKQQSGYHFSFGNKRLWEKNGGYVVAEINDKGKFINHQGFNYLDLREALDYMRTGKRL